MPDADDPVVFVLLHPPGANRRALARFLAARGHRVTELDETVQLATVDDSDPIPRVIVHADSVRGRAEAEFQAWRARCRRVPVLGISGNETGAARLEDRGCDATLIEPYYLEDLVRRLDAMTPKPDPVAEEPEARTAIEDTRALMLMPAILSAVGRSLAAPLVAAEGWLKLIAQDLAATDPVRGHVDHALREIAELNRQTELLSWFEGAQPLHPVSINLNATVEEILNASGARTIPIECDLAPDVPDVIGDRVMLRNAIECLFLAISDPGSRCERLRIATSCRDDRVELCFIESGRGLTNAQLAVLCTPGISLLYNPFARGLAFPAAHRILERHRVPMTVGAVDAGTTATRIVFDAVRPRGRAKDQNDLDDLEMRA